MSLVVGWLVIGIPAIAVAAVMFIGRSPRRALVGYLALIVGFAVMAMVDRVSAGVLGGVIALVYAAGRGGTMERDRDVEGRNGVIDAASGARPGRSHAGDAAPTASPARPPEDSGAAPVR